VTRDHSSTAPLSLLKIPKSFLSRMRNFAENAAIISTISHNFRDLNGMILVKRGDEPRAGSRAARTAD
jgi:hypothetical protein